MLTESEQAFLEKRRWRVRYWVPMGSALLAALCGLALFLWIRSRALVDPYWVLQKLEASALERSTLELMAVMLPVVVLALILVLLALILFAFAAFATERRYLRLLDRLLSTDSPDFSAGRKS